MTLVRTVKERYTPLFRTSDTKDYKLVISEDGLMNVENDKNELLSESWFNQVYTPCFPEGFFFVECEDGRFNFLKLSGGLLCESNYKDICFWASASVECNEVTFTDGFIPVQREDKLWNFIDENGIVLSQEWFSSVDNFFEGVAMVRRSKDGRQNFIKKDGTFLCKNWYKSLDHIIEGELWVKLDDDTWHHVSENGDVLD